MIKKTFSVIAVIVIAVLSSCSKKESITSKEFGKFDASQQFTTPKAKLDFINKEILKSATSNNPREISGISSDVWDKAKWDGKTINYKNMSKQELADALFPGEKSTERKGSVMLGIEELYNTHKPFKNAKNPTWAEIDEWNRITIEHLRRLMGVSKGKAPISKNPHIFLRAWWAAEFKDHKSGIWNQHYSDDAWKHCIKNNLPYKPHCGDNFIPPVDKQKGYYPKGFKGPAKKSYGSAGGIFGVDTSSPWTIKLSKVIYGTIRGEGMKGHSGPFFIRPEFGISFYPSNENPKSMKVVFLTSGKKATESDYPYPFIH